MTKTCDPSPTRWRSSTAAVTCLATDKSESTSRAAYMDLLSRVGELPEGGTDFYERWRDKAPNGNGSNGDGHGRMGPVTRL